MAQQLNFDDLERQQQVDDMDEYDRALYLSDLLRSTQTLNELILVDEWYTWEDNHEPTN